MASRVRQRERRDIVRNAQRDGRVVEVFNAGESWPNTSAGHGLIAVRVEPPIDTKKICRFNPMVLRASINFATASNCFAIELVWPVNRFLHRRCAVCQDGVHRTDRSIAVEAIRLALSTNRLPLVDVEQLLVAARRAFLAALPSRNPAVRSCRSVGIAAGSCCCRS